MYHFLTYDISSSVSVSSGAEGVVNSRVKRGADLVRPTYWAASTRPFPIYFAGPDELLEVFIVFP